MKKLTALLLTMVMLLASTCYAEFLTSELGFTVESKPATTYTVEVNSAVYSMLDFAATSEYDNAVRGLIDTPEVLELTDAEGNVISNTNHYSVAQYASKNIADDTNNKLSNILRAMMQYIAD